VRTKIVDALDEFLKNSPLSACNRLREDLLSYISRWLSGAYWQGQTHTNRSCADLGERDA